MRLTGALFAFPPFLTPWVSVPAVQVVVYYCRGCLRYLNPPNSWVTADLESRELLQLLLKKLKGLDKVTAACWLQPRILSSALACSRYQLYSWVANRRTWHDRPPS